MYKIKLLNKISKNGLSLLDPKAFEYAEDMENPDAILVRSAEMKEMALPESLLCVGRAGAGTNNIPIQKCSENGIVVFNTPGANANAVKELAVCALLLSSRKIARGIEWAKGLKGQGADIPKLVEKGKSQFAGPEIMGKTLGVIGLGAIGVDLANAAVELGMEVYGYDPYLSLDSAWGLSRRVIRAKDLRTIFENCDYISLHVPLNDETRATICEKNIAMMKDGVRVINLARGELANDADVGVALASGKIACYVTDFPNETVLGFENVVPIPHLGASSPESEENCAVMAVRQVDDYLRLGNIKNSVNLPDVELPAGGVCRVCVIHRNVPNVLSNISSLFGAECINIDNMINKSKKDFAYTIVDLSTLPDESIVEKLQSLESIVRVRVIKF